MDDQKRGHMNLKRILKRNCPKQQQTNNVPSYDVENTLGTKKGRYLFLANKPRIVPYIDQHIQREQDETQKSSYDLDWLKKVIRYGPSKLDYKLSQNVYNIWWSHKL